MTLGELKALLASEPPENDKLPIAVWLPGSRIDLDHRGTLISNGLELLIEGSVRPGSALSRTSDK